MKPAQDSLRNYEYAFRQPEFVRPTVKYDNRGLTAATLRFWPTAQNTREKIVATGADVPSNDVLGRLTEKYAAAFEQRLEQA